LCLIRSWLIYCSGIFSSEAPRGKPRGIFAEPCEAKNAILPCGKPQGILAEKGDGGLFTPGPIVPLGGTTGVSPGIAGIFQINNAGKLRDV